MAGEKVMELRSRLAAGRCFGGPLLSRPPGEAGQPVHLRFTYDLNGLLEVEAYVPKTGAKFRTVLRHHVKGLSEDEIDDAIRRLQQIKFYPRDEAQNVDLVRLALQDPAALAKQRESHGLRDDAARHPDGVIIDISRKRVLLDGEPAGLTYKEFELLQYLVLREGRTIERTELVSSLWQGATEDEAPGERTIDVHVRRLRAKLGRYEDIVRTVRGVGYRFDRHADVAIHYGHGTPSPDRF